MDPTRDPVGTRFPAEFARWEQYAAEALVNQYRVLALLLLYAIHCLHYYTSSRTGMLPSWLVGEAPTPPTPALHSAITLIVTAWLLGAIAVHVILRRPWFPPWLTRVSVVLDAMALTCVLIVARGPQSPLVAYYLILIAAAALRWNRDSVRWATGTAVLGYLAVLGNARWDWIGPTFPAAGTVPRYHQALFLIALVLMGSVMGRLVSVGRDVMTRSTTRETTSP